MINIVFCLDQFLCFVSFFNLKFINLIFSAIGLVVFYLTVIKSIFFDSFNLTSVILIFISFFIFFELEIIILLSI